MDKAAVRRFGKRIFVPKPSFEDRKEILKVHLSRDEDGKCNATEKQLNEWASLSHGLSASDLSKF